MRERPIVHSSGGGVQSTAVCVLIAQGKLPKPDISVIADTSREQSAVWEYLETHIHPLLTKAGVPLEIAPHSLATVDLYSRKGDLLLPMYTENGKLPIFCSTEWKKRVVRRYIRTKGYGPANPCVTWIGISVDEVSRIKDSDVNWQRYEYPLIDLGLSRKDCVELVLGYGLPTPPRSSCWMCPFHSDAEWLHIKTTMPEDWQKAVELEQEIQAKDAGLAFHKSRVPLDQVIFKGEAESTDGVCDSGYCFV